jgi:hypothetical protein
MDDGEITVVVEGEDASAAHSSVSRIEALNRQADRDHGIAARARLETARLNREGAIRKIEVDLLTTESEARAAEAAYRDARELGDVDAEVAAQRRLTATETKRANLEMQQAAWQHAPISSGDPLEDHFSRFTDRTAAWMRAHKDWVTDQRKSAKLTGAHNFAVSEGLTPDTDEYEEFVEKMIGMRGGNGASNRGGSNMRRSSSNINPNDVNTHVQDGGVFLTKGERERANDGSIVWNTGPNKGKAVGNAEYARRKAAMIAEGRYNKL